MDEGLNTFVQYLTEELWDNKFPSKRGPAWTIVDYMKLPKSQLEPIMTNSENIVQFGPNAYAKPATGLNILRETIMGRNLFDFAFKEYARRWAFKHPTPADLFRTMEDASGEDLDWFWRGWFYGINPVDISLDSVKVATAEVNGMIPPAKSVTRKIDAPMVPEFDDLSKIRNREDRKIAFYTDEDTGARDFYWRYARGQEPYDSTKTFTVEQAPGVEALTAEAKQQFAGKYFYELDFSNKGGMVMPIIIEWTFSDGTRQIDRIPAQIWRHNENTASKVFVKNKAVTGIRLDPFRETADIDESNNVWNQMPAPTRFKAFAQKTGAARGQSTGSNPMQQAQKK